MPILPHNVRFGIYLAEHLLDALKRVAQYRGISISGLIVMILWDWIQENYDPRME